ncbi:MAG: glycyl-radical enzyme activating protein [Bacteroidota bacterium]|nr:glycyl-radical enzyme activating protein [Bacteroidota bacterium]
MQGLIFSVKRYSVHDGPGIRITFFMKGCPLSCWWCHNPEGLNPSVERVTLTRKVGEKEFRETEEVGKLYSVENILEIIEKDSIFLRQSKGGVTFSGGEPMMQLGFLAEALRACKDKGYHTAVDTSGYSPGENYMKIIPVTDLFLFDIKHLNDTKHIEYTGVSNMRILDNLRMILNSGKDVMVRIPVIPGKNDDPVHLSELREFLAGLKCDNLRRINLLPFHRIGASKYKRFDLPYRMDDTRQPSHERMKELKEFFLATGIKVKIGG